ASLQHYTQRLRRRIKDSLFDTGLLLGPDLFHHSPYFHSPNSSSPGWFTRLPN
ncbi:predicted protein, partial [Arabidopsis lyrata subsp. lyrata]